MSPVHAQPSSTTKALLSRRPLTPNAENAVALRSHAGSVQDQWELALSNARFAYKMAKDYAGSGLPIDDLFNVALHAMFEVAHKFDGRAIRFIGYAQANMRRRLSLHIAEFGREFRLPIRVASARARAVRDVGLPLVESLSTENLAERMAIGVRTARMLKQLVSAPIPLDSVSPAYENSTAAGDRVPDESAAMPGADIEEADELADLAELLGHLSPRERLVIGARFGLDGDGEQTLQDVATGLRVTRERVRQIEFKALRRLRAKAVLRENRRAMERHEASMNLAA